MELEAALEETRKEAMSGGFAPREKKDPAEWIPRGPERAELHGHRSPVTRVLFHPQYNLLVTASEDSQIKVLILISGKIKVTFCKSNLNYLDIIFRSGIQNQVNTKKHSKVTPTQFKILPSIPLGSF